MPISTAPARFELSPSRPNGETSNRARRADQSGSSAVEFALIAIPLLLVAMGGIEIAHWLSVKQTVSLALLEAARAASVAHAKPAVIEQAFEQALLPLYASNHRAQTKARLERALQQRQQALNHPPWRIVIHSPSAAAYLDHATAAVAIQGLATINNDYQQEQDLRYRRQGWAGGKGPLSQQTIFQANTLSMSLTYLHQPVLPGVSGLLKQLYRSPQSYEQAAMQHGYLPMTRTLTLIMQSHPVNWPSLSSGKVVHAHERTAPTPLSTHPGAATSCTGAWCLRAWNVSAQGRADQAHEDSAASQSNSGMQEYPVAGIGQAWSTPTSNLTTATESVELISDDDPLCGVTLCCG